MLSYKAIRLLIVVTTNFELNGVTNVVLNYYRAMDKSDMQIDFVVINDIDINLRDELEANNSKINKMSYRNSRPLLYIKKLSELIRKNEYDIVHAHGNSCTLAVEMYAAKKGGAKVRIPHSHNTQTKYKIINKLLRRSFDSLYTHGFACGEKAGKWLYQKGEFEIIQNGIDIDKYKYNKTMREDYRKRHDLDGNKVVGHIGHFSYQKNHEYIVDVFNELYSLDSNYRLLLIGDGVLKDEIQNKVNRLGLSDVVIFTGNSLEVPQLIQTMDVIVMPSRFEGLPLTLVEAQAACLPCFVSDAVSSEVAITNLVQFISLDNSPKEWAMKINSLKTEEREHIANRIPAQIVNAGYSIYDNAKKVKKLYKQYIEEQNGKNEKDYNYN